MIEAPVLSRDLTTHHLVPIGCDCHPAYLVRSLGLQTTGYPFDWMNMDSVWGLHYVHDNITHQFRYYVKDLCIEIGTDLPYASRYPYATFFHHRDIIESEKTRHTLERRAGRFKNLNNDISEPWKVTYLYCVRSNDLDSHRRTATFLESIRRFVPTLRSHDHWLWIFVRFDESERENQAFCNKVLGAEFENVRILPYNRQLTAFGIWGDQKTHPVLLNRFAAASGQKVDVELHLAGEHVCRTRLDSNSELLQNMLSATFVGRTPELQAVQLFQVPVNEGRSTFSFSSRRLKAVVIDRGRAHAPR